MKKNDELLRLYLSCRKKLIIMRNALFIIMIASFQVFATGSYSQTTRLDLEMKGATVKEVLNEIEENSEFYFLYNSELIDVNKRVNVSVKNKKIETILNQIFDKSEVDVLYKDRHIIITPKGKTVAVQQKTVSGTVTDRNGEPLPGLTVVVKGTSKGVVTDFDGKFSIDGVSAEDVLIFSFVGMKTQEVPIGDQTNLEIIMAEETFGLDEVVAIGYGTVKKSDLTGAVGSVDMEVLQKNAVPTIDQALGGKLSGVMVSTNSATPGGGASIRIRGAGSIGNSEPLYVIDGVTYNVSQSEYSSPLSNINFNDIESIEVLKDASAAAIYGSRAANGVILIKTKSGKAQKGKISYSGYYGMQNLYNPMEVMNSEQWVDFVNTSYINSGQEPIIPDPENYKGEGTDWLGVLENKNAPTQNHQLSFSGGNDKNSSYTSLAYNKVEGTLDYADFERISFRSNNERKITDNFTVGANISFVRSEQLRNNTNDWTRSDLNSYYPRVNYFPPTIEPYDDEGNIAPIPLLPQYGAHAPPHWVGKYQGNTNKTNELIGSIYAKWQIIEPLTFNSRASFTHTTTKDTNATPIRELGNSYDPEASTYRNVAEHNGYVLENTLTYTNDFGKHNISILVGNTLEDNEWEAINTSSVWADDGWIITGDFATTSQFTNNIQENSLVSFFGRAFYNYNDKYMASFILRRDGSSRFGANNKWGTFPSASAAWRISEEEFFPESEFISSWKLRGGWGQIGNENIGNYRYTATIGNTYAYPFGNQAGTVSTGSSPNQSPNPDLKWETTTTSYIGTDIILLNGKFSISADYYSNKRDDMLLNVPVSGVTGLSSGGGLASTLQNAASLTNKGFEFSLDHSGTIGELEYTINANITTVNNEITSLGDATELVGYQFNNVVWSKATVGTSLGEFYGYVWDGVFQNQTEIDNHATQNAVPGDFKFKDISGPDGVPDGVIDENDQTYIGSPQPDMFYGINADLYFKNFDFSMQFSGSVGNEVLNISRQAMIDGTRGNFNKLADYVNYWDGEGSTNYYPRAAHTDPNRNIRNSSYFVEDGSYLRCKLLQLGYTFPNSVCSKLKLSKLRLYTSVQNAFVLTDYSGPDPEVGNQYGDSNRAGVDMFLYPRPRTVLFGINLDF